MDKTIQTRIVKNGHGDYWVQRLENNLWRDVTGWDTVLSVRKSAKAAESTRQVFLERLRKNQFKTVETFVDTL